MCYNVCVISKNLHCCPRYVILKNYERLNSYILYITRNCQLKMWDADTVLVQSLLQQVFN